MVEFHLGLDGTPGQATSSISDDLAGVIPGVFEVARFRGGNDISFLNACEVCVDSDRGINSLNRHKEEEI
jgi:hypothetical protein